MENILIGVADDEQFIHDLFRKSLEDVQNTSGIKCEIKDFYDTDELLDYCYDNIEVLDILFLDIDFGRGNPQGTDALADIREICPKLDIYMLSGMKLRDEDTLGFTETYEVEFIDKPVRSVILSSKIIAFKKRMEDYIKILREAKESKELIGILEEEYADTQKDLAEFILKTNERINNAIKKDTKILIEEVFDNLEFTPLAIAEILNEKTFDKRVYKLLKIINNGDQLSNGIKKQPFYEWKIEKLFEYRYSRTGRIFLQEKGKGQKPLVYCLDYNHKKHNSY